MAEEAIGLLFGVEGGGSIDGRSGKLIVEDLTKIVKQINSGKSTVPKITLQFNVSEAKKAISEIKKQLDELKKASKIKISQNQSRKTGSRKSSGQSDEAKKAADNYRKLTSNVKEYNSALVEVDRISKKSSGVYQTPDGEWKTTDKDYEKRIAKLNELKETYDGFVKTNKDGSVELTKTAKELGISQEQYNNLLRQTQSAATSTSISSEKSSAAIRAAWDKNAAKVHEYIQRVQEVAKKNPEVAEAMRKLDELAKSGDPKNLDKLSKGFANLQQKIRKSGADIETWGQKFSKNFSAHIRSVLAAAITAKVTQSLHEIYTNVKKLDEAVVNLQIASGKSRSEVKSLIKDYADLGKQLGATAVEVAEGADTWLRQGYEAEEASTLIKNSTMLSKLGQMDATEAATALTSAMKGYKVAVEDSSKIVDKFTAVDMEAAASAGDIATAMAETATSADIAGVSMDKLIGYIATVKEVTQDGAESVGKRIAQQYSNVLQVGNNIGQRPEVAETEVMLCFISKNVAV